MKLAQMEAIATPLGRERLMTRHDHDNPTLSDDLAFLTELGGLWKPWMQRLQREGPTAVAGGLAGFEVTPTVVNSTTITGSATEQTIIPIALMPIRQNVQSSTVYQIMAGGTSTTAASAGTYTFSPRIGPAPTNASPAIGVVPTAAFTAVNSQTAAPWTLNGFVLIRGGGSANTAVAFFDFAQTGGTTAATGGPSIATTTGQFGGISASFDGTQSTTALWLGVTHATSTTNTWIPQAVAWWSVN